MRNILPFSLFILVVVCAYFGFNKYAYLINPPENQIVLYGVVRSLGLTDVSKSKLGLNKAMFQITSLNGGKYTLNGVNYERFYLMPTVWNLSGQEGKCVEVGGVLNPNFDHFINYISDHSKPYTYQGLVLDPRYIVDAPAGKCTPYALESAEPVLEQIRLFNGKISRYTRPAPDVSYDYQFTSTPDATPQKQIYQAVPANNEIWKQLEKTIGKLVTIQGVVRGSNGSGVSQYLEIHKIQLL